MTRFRAVLRQELIAVISAAALFIPGSYDCHAGVDVTAAQKWLIDQGKLVGTFLEEHSNGRKLEGKIYMSLPGRMRLEYSIPYGKMIIIDGETIAYFDEIDGALPKFYSLNKIEWASLILSGDFSLKGNSYIIGAQEDGNMISIYLSNSPEAKEYMVLYFSKVENRLRGWYLSTTTSNVLFTITEAEDLSFIDLKLFDIAAEIRARGTK